MIIKRKDIDAKHGDHPEPQSKTVKFDGFTIRLETKYSWNGPGSFDDPNKTGYTKTLHIV